MTRKELFKVRLKHHMHFYNHLRLVAVDWAVWVYIFVPLLLVGLYQYVALWNMELDWSILFNEKIFLLMVTGYVLSGVSYSFLRMADVLYLWQKRNLIKGLRHYRLGYFYVVALVKTLVFTGIIAPVLFHYLEWGSLKIVVSGIVIYALHSLLVLIKRELKIRLGKWPFRLLMVSLLMVVYLLILLMINALWLLLLIAVTGTVIYITNSFRIKQNFHKEIELDSEQKSKVMQLVLMQSVHIGGPEFLSETISGARKGPWLFRKSYKLFKGLTPEIGYKEMFIKSLLRSKNWVLFYVQIIGVGLFGIVIFPVWMKWLMWIGMLFLTGHLLKTYWNKVVSHRFLDLVKWRKVDDRIVARDTFRVVILPAWLVLSVAIGYITLSVWGIIVVPIVGLLLSFGIVEFFANKVLTIQ